MTSQGHSGEESACQCRRFRLHPWVGKIPWRRAWPPTPVFLPGEPHGRGSLAGCSPRGHEELDRTERAHTHSTAGSREPLRIFSDMGTEFQSRARGAQLHPPGYHSRAPRAPGGPVSSALGQSPKHLLLSVKGNSGHRSGHEKRGTGRSSRQLGPPIPHSKIPIGREFFWKTVRMDWPPRPCLSLLPLQLEVGHPRGQVPSVGQKMCCSAGIRGPPASTSRSGER